MSARRIYVASLSDYNNGDRHGEWIDTKGKDAEELQEDVNVILRGSKYPNVMVEYERSQVPSAEEFAIHDHEGFGNAIGEWSTLQEVAELDALLEEHGDAYLAYIEHGGSYSTPQGFEDSYEGIYELKLDWGWAFAESTGMLDGVSDVCRNYFDMEAFVRDCEYNGDIVFVELNDSTYAFRNI